MTELSTVAPKAQLRYLVENTSLALRDVGQTLCEIETVLLDHRHESFDSNSKPIDLQQMDIVLQSIEEISQLLQRLCNALPEELSVDPQTVLAPIRLQWLQDRVQGDVTTKRLSNSGIVSGRVSLF